MLVLDLAVKLPGVGAVKITSGSGNEHSENFDKALIQVQSPSTLDHFLTLLIGTGPNSPERCLIVYGKRAAHLMSYTLQFLFSFIVM